MRTLSVLLSVAAVATVAYVLGPRLIEAYHEREALVADEPVVAVAEDTRQRDAQTFDAVGATGVTASLSHLRQVALAPKTKFKPAKNRTSLIPSRNRTAGKVTPPSSRRRSAAVERAELKKLGLEPAKKSLRLASAEPEPVRAPRAPGVFSPMAGRWVDGLSGPKARLGMGLKEQRDGCANNYSNCTRRGAPDDVKLTGVVVKTERLAKHPSRPLGGIIKAGHYLDETPAVYVE